MVFEYVDAQSGVYFWSDVFMLFLLTFYWLNTIKYEMTLRDLPTPFYKKPDFHI